VVEVKPKTSKTKKEVLVMKEARMKKPSLP
jgi:hypothetical protein